MKLAIIVAAGAGNRAGGPLPKQFQPVCGRPMLWWSIRAFHLADPDTAILLVLHPDHFRTWRDLFFSLKLEEQFPHCSVAGGSTRWESVKLALMQPFEGMTGIDLVAVHDAARPMLTPKLVSRLWEEAVRKKAVVPAVPVTDSLRRIIDSQASKAVDRNFFRAVQTPQVFTRQLLLMAYALPYRREFTDDASVVEALGNRVEMVEGDPDNIKVTYPRDFLLAEAILSRR